MNAQEQFWGGEAGDAYTQRNLVDWWARVPFWSRIMAMTLPHTVVEVGCNAGWNLMAMRACWPEFASPDRKHLIGLDINKEAFARAWRAGFITKHGSFDDLMPAAADLVFTSGVLIHVAPENLEEAMHKVVAASKQYVLAIEYEHGFEQEIEYRGERQRLWKRPFGALYLKQGLRLVEYWPSVEGWDRCAAWLMEKN